MSSIILPLVSNNLNLKASSVCVSFLGLGLGEQVHYSFLGRIWTVFCFVPVALIPQVIQDDHLQVHNHHGCTRIAKDSSGDLGDAHLQVQIHHD